MPFTEKQRRLFNAADHDPEIARENGMDGREAGHLSDEANKLKKQGKERPAVKSFIDLSGIWNN
jgi:hypothetical protein